MLDILCIGIAIGSLSLTITKSSPLRIVRLWAKEISPFLGKVLSCPWCLSHYLAAIAILVYPEYIAIGVIVTWMLLVSIATITAGLMFLAYTSIYDVDKE